jgi:hypothetical protein
MNGNDEQYARRVKSYLDQGSADVKPGVAYRLQQARAAALARLAGEARTAGAGTFAGAATLAGAGGATFDTGAPRSDRPLYAQPRAWIALIALAAALYGWQQWTAWQELEMIEDLDSQILTSDLPIDAYLDRGFQLWLKTPPSSD